MYENKWLSDIHGHGLNIIDFGTEPQFISDELYNFITSNAKTGSYVIYDDQFVSVVEEGKSIDLLCQNFVAKSDITIYFPNGGTFTYDGVTNDFLPKQTVTLSCANKLMKTNISVMSHIIDTPTDDIRGTWHLNDSVDAVPIMSGAGSSVKFTCNGAIYTGMEGSAPDVIRYWPETGGRVEVYDNGWVSSEYQVINVLEYDDTSEFSEWLKANGKRLYNITYSTSSCSGASTNPTVITQGEEVIVKFAPRDTEIGI